MKLIYFKRSVDDGFTRVGSSAEIAYIPDEDVAISKLTAGMAPQGYELNMYPVILEEGSRIYKDEKPYSEGATISSIRHIEADEKDVRQFLEDLRSQKTLQERIESTGERIFSLDKK